MKKKCYIPGFLVAMFLFQIMEYNHSLAQNGFANYITISNGEFYDGNQIFKPLCINYLVDYACNIKDSSNVINYIAPLFNYSDTGSGHKETIINDSIYDWHWCYGPDGQTEMVTAIAKLDSDLLKIKNLEFNVVRLRPAIYWKNNTLHIPTGSYTKYFELTDGLIEKCAAQGLRVILVLEADTNGFVQLDKYNVYLDSVTRHYSTNKAVMAYVVFAEPSWKWTNLHINDKIMISNWSRKWYYLIKKNAPFQLVTYGLDGLGNVLIWDPSALTYDFLSMHFYYGISDPNKSKMAIHSYFRWMNDNIEDVWVLGETGFSGTEDTCQADPRVGSEMAQYQYAEYTMLKALSCGCKGYSWWQYQDVTWADCLQNHLGIYTRYPNVRPKNVASLFPSYPPHPQYLACNKPDCYYNIPGDSIANISGLVIDHWKQIWHGSIKDWQINSTDKFYSGDFNGDGYDEVLCVQNVVNGWATIYQYVYNPHQFNNPWQNIWTNSGNGNIGNWNYRPGDIILSGYFNDTIYCSLLCMRNTFRPTGSCQRLYSGSWETLWSPTIGFGPIDTTVTSPTGFDRYYVGDFNGDGIDELFCTEVSQNSTDIMKLIRYDNGWNTQWTNNGQSDGVGIYPYRANLHVGNFDVDRADELLGVGTWATKFDFNSTNQWDWSWSTYESGRLSDWSVNPNHRIFFLKTMTDVPDYLFVGRWPPRTFRLDAYSFDSQ